MDHPVSCGQQGLFFLHQASPESAAYNVACPVRVQEPIDSRMLGRAVRLTAERHDVLRSLFVDVGGRPVRRTGDAGLFGVEVIDVDGVGERTLQALVRREVDRPFRLAETGAARVVLLRCGPADAVLVLVAHHIVLDFPSLMFVLKELLEDYQVLIGGREPEHPPAKLTYADFVAKEEALLDSPRSAEMAAYWNEVCRGVSPAPTLPYDRPRAAARSLRGSSHHFTLSPELVAAGTRVARAARVTPVRHLLGVFEALLHRFAGPEEFLVGCAKSSTFGLLHRGVPGHYTNVLPLRTCFGPGTTFRQAVDDANRQLGEARGRADFPFSRMSCSAEGPGAPPALTVLTSMVSCPGAGSPIELGHGADVTLGGLRLSGIDLPQQAGQFDLTLEVVRCATTVRCALKYDTDLFDRGTAVRISDHFVRLLAAAAADPDRKISTVSLLDESELARVLGFAAGR